MSKFLPSTTSGPYGNFGLSNSKRIKRMSNSKKNCLKE